MAQINVTDGISDSIFKNEYSQNDVEIITSPIEVNEDWFFLDVIFCSVVLFLLTPLFVIITIFLKSTGPVFYRQRRVGRNGALFSIIKFRTMVENAELKTGPVLACEDDPRITKFGAFLRKTHFDEFPQLINVLMGDMALIGPRPERPEFTKEFERKIPGYVYRTNIRPGITGLAQIKLPYGASASEKIKYDLYYLDNKESIKLNIRIFIGTFFKMMGLSKMKTTMISRVALSLLVGVSFNAFGLTQKIVFKKACEVYGPVLLFPEKSEDLLITGVLPKQMGVEVGTQLSVSVFGRLTTEDSKRLLLEGLTSPLACVGSTDVCNQLGFSFYVPAKKIKNFNPQDVEMAEFETSVVTTVGNKVSSTVHLSLVSKNSELLKEGGDTPEIVSVNEKAIGDVIDNSFGQIELDVIREQSEEVYKERPKENYVQVSPALLIDKNIATFIYLPETNLTNSGANPGWSTTTATGGIQKITDFKSLFLMPDFSKLTSPMNTATPPLGYLWVAPKKGKETNTRIISYEGTSQHYVLLPGQKGQVKEVSTTVSQYFHSMGPNQCGLAVNQDKYKKTKILVHEELSIF